LEAIQSDEDEEEPEEVGAGDARWSWFGGAQWFFPLPTRKESERGKGKRRRRLGGKREARLGFVSAKEFIG
jgi:hypothetical protein